MASRYQLKDGTVYSGDNIPFGGDTGKALSYIKNYRVTDLGAVVQALNFGALNTLMKREMSLTPEERFAVMIWGAFVVMLLFTVWSALFSPRAQKRRLLAQQKADRLARPWHVLSLFHGSLFVIGPKRRPEPPKETKLGVLHRLAGKPDVYTQCEVVSAFSYIAELMQKKMPGVIAQDLSLVLLWSSSPAPAVSQRIPLMLAVLALNASNRERLGNVNGAMKTLVAAARAASKLKQLHALLAMAICARNRVLSQQLIGLGVVEVLAAIIASKEAGARPRQRQDVLKDGRLVLSATVVLAELAQWPEHRRHFSKLAFLRSVIALTRVPDVRQQLAAVTLLASLAQGSSEGADLRTSILDAGALVAMIPLASSRSAAVQAQACRVLLSLIGGYGPGWAKRLRGICVSADDAHSEQVWEVRWSRVVAGMPLMLKRVETLAEARALSVADAREAVSALGAVIDGVFFDPASKPEELGDDETEAEDDQSEATEESDESARSRHDTYLPKVEVGAHQGEETSDSDDVSDFVSASNSPQISAPSTPRARGAAGEGSGAAVDIPKVKLAAAVETLERWATREADGGFGGEGKTPRGSQETTPRSGLSDAAVREATPRGKSLTPREKAFQAIKTTFVDASPSASPGASPASSPSLADGVGKALLARRAGMGGRETEDETLDQGTESDDMSDSGSQSDDASANSRSSGSRSASSRYSTASKGQVSAASSVGSKASGSQARSSASSYGSALHASSSASLSSAGVSTAAASAADTLAAAAAAAMGSGDPGPSQARAPGHEEDDELEERMRQMVSEHGGAERWGRQYSSLTHRSILEGFRALEGCGADGRSNMQVVSLEAMALVWVDLNLLLWEQAQAQLPLLLQELRRHYDVDAFTESALTPQQIEEMQQRGMSINRPLESVLIIFRQLRREVIEVSRVVSSNHRKRTQQSRLPWDFYAEFPMFQDSWMSPADAATEVSSLGAEDQKTTDNPIGGGGGNAATTMATADFEWDEARTVSMQLRIFLAEYHTSYVTERSLVAQSQLLPRSGKRPEVMMNRQFVRDVPSLLKLNGAPPPGESPEDQVRYVYDSIVKAVEGNTEKAQRITIVCNQNLGIFLYEKLVHVYADNSDVMVMQTGQHSLDLRTLRRGVVAVFESIFRLVPHDTVTENEGNLVKAIVKVDFVHKSVSYKFSKPRADAAQG